MQRLTPDERRAVILRAAVQLTKERGLFEWSRHDVVNHCEIATSHSTVKHYFTQPDLRAAVKRAIGI